VSFIHETNVENGKVDAARVVPSDIRRGMPKTRPQVVDRQWVGNAAGGVSALAHVVHLVFRALMQMASILNVRNVRGVMPSALVTQQGLREIRTEESRNYFTAIAFAQSSTWQCSKNKEMRARFVERYSLARLTLTTVTRQDVSVGCSAVAAMSSLVPSIEMASWKRRWNI